MMLPSSQALPDLMFKCMHGCSLLVRKLGEEKAGDFLHGLEILQIAQAGRIRQVETRVSRGRYPSE